MVSHTHVRLGDRWVVSHMHTDEAGRQVSGQPYTHVRLADRWVVSHMHTGNAGRQVRDH